ncbi:MAG: cation diffusion facilitator family transporter [Balneolaceae bacterium]
MSHHHSHKHKHDSTENRLWISIFLNLGITIAEVIGGILSNSLALISDALHNLSDTTSLGISLIARKISKRSPNRQKTFGYKRAEIIAAFINLVTLVFIALFLIKEAVERFFDPQPVIGSIMLWVAVAGLAGNVITAILLYRDSKTNINIKSAYVHIFWDAISSVAVIIGGIIIWLYGLYVVDTIITVLISVYILYHSFHLLKETIDILMESTPDDIEISEIEHSIETIPHVLDAHHVHVWNLNEEHRLLECHVKIDRSKADDLEKIKSDIKNLLMKKFSINHSTLEFELEHCGDKEKESCY